MKYSEREKEIIKWLNETDEAQFSTMELIDMYCDKLQKENKELKTKTKWYRPEQLPGKNNNYQTNSCVVFARWGENGEYSTTVWYCYITEEWKYTRHFQPFPYNKFKWTYLPELPKEGETK